MKEFNDRIRLTSSQRNEVQRYLNCSTVLTEEVILKIVRKMKEIERRINETQYNR